MMRRRSATVAAAVAVAAVCAWLVAGAGAAAAGARGAAGAGAAAGGVWGTAAEIPGIAALDKGGFPDFRSVSCASAGNCAAGGDYTDGSGDGNVFVVDERNGIWGTAKQVAGIADPGAVSGTGISSVSCAAAGECAAGGGFPKFYDNEDAFVVDEKNGTWHRGIEVPG